MHFCFHLAYVKIELRSLRLYKVYALWSQLKLYAVPFLYKNSLFCFHGSIDISLPNPPPLHENYKRSFKGLCPAEICQKIHLKKFILEKRKVSTALDMISPPGIWF